MLTVIIAFKQQKEKLLLVKTVADSMPRVWWGKVSAFVEWRDCGCNNYFVLSFNQQNRVTNKPNVYDHSKVPPTEQSKSAQEDTQGAIEKVCYG